MKISVIVCTYNRCGQLAGALNSIAASTFARAVEWDVVVVDNNSSDQTRAVVEQIGRQNPGRFQYLSEAQPGKSNALNAGIREAQGDVLAFTDDDVNVEPTWLENLTAPLNDSQWSGVGGKIILQWPQNLSKWMSIEGSYARHGFPALDLGSDAKELIGPLPGTNMAVRKSMFARYGYFRPDLGPSSSGEIPGAGEDAEFSRRLISVGKRFRYEPSAVVYHSVPESMIDKKYLLKRRFDGGRAIAREFRSGPKHAELSLAAWTLRWMISIDSRARFYRKLVVWEKAGTIAELRRQSSAAKQKKALNQATIKQDAENQLGLKAGEWVEVRTWEEIRATLDERGRLGNLPFMQEMLPFCGKQLRVDKRADKTCDNIEQWSLRRMTNAVHLEGIRCDGDGHGACEAGCLIFWKEAWLKRSSRDVVSRESLETAPVRSVPTKDNGFVPVARILEANSQTIRNGETIYSCQATELLTYTTHMKSWDPRQYVRDLRSGNLDSGLAGDSRAHRSLEFVLGTIKIFHAAAIGFFNTVQEKRHWRPTYPFLEGSTKKTPTEVLDLQPGEIVQVRSKEEILATLDKQNRNRGMLFDAAMLTFCGGIYRVLRKVSRIIDERSGKMLEMKNPCIILEGVTCRWDYHRLCPKAAFPYWRENWLKRATDSPAADAAVQVAETCEKC